MSKCGRSLIKGLKNSIYESIGTWDLYKDKSLVDRIYMTLYTCDMFDWAFNSYYAICTFFNNCARLIEYAPLVWQHRNWDHGFVLLFNKKLYEDLYKGCYVKGNHIFTRKEARKLKAVISLFDRIQKEEYDAWQHSYMDRKYGKSEIKFVKIPNTEDKPGGPHSTMICTREEAMNKEQRKDYIKDRKRMWKHEDYQKKQDLDLLGKYIAKYSRKWWT